MASGIYAIWNVQTDKIYIGQAVDIKKRWKDHRIELKLNRHRNKYLQSAHNKYNIGLVFYVIEFCDTSLLDDREQFYMDLYNSYDREYGYNLSPTAGGSCAGYKHSEETLANWSAQRKGKTRSNEAKAAIKAGWEKRKAKGPVSEETKRKLSESHKGKIQTDEFKEAARQRLRGNKFNTGRKQSIEEIEARRISNTGKTRTDAQKARMSARQTGRVVSDETKLKMSIAARLRRERKANLQFKASMLID